MSVCHFHVPGEAAKREYAVYLIIARHRHNKTSHVYVGKTGDNREGCNPVISRAGNHLSFNILHSQSRNHLGDPENYDFDFVFTSFGDYVPPSQSRQGIDLINEMERRLNVLAQEAFGKIINPLKLAGHVPRAEKQRREQMLTPARLAQLMELITRVNLLKESGQ